MKIGIDVRLWNETGVGRYIRNLVKYLNKIDDTNKYVLFARTEDIEDIRFLVQSSGFKVVKADFRWHSFQEQLIFPWKIYRERLDLMHFPYYSWPVLYTKPFVITIHDLIIYHYPTGKASTLPLPLYLLKRLVYKWLLKNAVNRAVKIIVPLKTVKEDLVRSLYAPDDKIFITNEGIDVESFSGPAVPDLNFIDKDINFFLYVGNAYPHKNLNTLIEAYKIFSRTHPGPLLKREGKSEVQLFLVGKKDYFYNQLEQKKEKDQKNIKVLHNIDDQQLSYLYQHALAVVCPSFMEGFGLVPLEALSFGCHVIASDIPSHREVCKDSVVYFDPQSAGDLAAKMSEALTNHPDTRNRVKAAKRLRIFSWKEMARKTLTLYEQAKR